MVTRRNFLAGTGATLGLGATALGFGGFPAFAQQKPRVVVVGGGPGGVTAAKYIAKDAKGAIEVVLVEPKDAYTTCFHSNLYLGGFKTFEEITHRYDGVVSKYGIKHIRQWAKAVDRDKKQIVLSDGVRLPYDRLVLSPGIDLKYDSIPGWSKAAEEVMPHAWQAGPQTRILHKQLAEVKAGGVIVVVPPPNPYRCPPGPYERVSMMAHALKSSGRGTCKIIIIDPKESYSKQGLFQAAWEQLYPGMIEWLGPKVNDGIKSVDPASMSVVTGFETYKNCALVNVIPAQHAGAIAREAGLANATGWCPIKPASMQSSLDPNIYILGDASIAGDMPKSAFSANSQAKVAAMMIRAELVGSPAFPARYSNTCWSLLSPDNTVKVGGRYEPKPDKITAAETFISQANETPDHRKQVQSENIGWYAGITADMFS